MRYSLDLSDFTDFPSSGIISSTLNSQEVDHGFCQEEAPQEDREAQAPQAAQGSAPQEEVILCFVAWQRPVVCVRQRRAVAERCKVVV